MNLDFIHHDFIYDTIYLKLKEEQEESAKLLGCLFDSEKNLYFYKHNLDLEKRILINKEFERVDEKNLKYLQEVKKE